MGRIKGTIIKRSSKDLIAYNREKFDSDFSNNKKTVIQLLPEVNKKMINSIAGYVTRLIRRDQEKSK